MQFFVCCSVWCAIKAAGELGDAPNYAPEETLIDVRVVEDDAGFADDFWAQRCQLLKVQIYHFFGTFEDLHGVRVEEDEETRHFFLASSAFALVDGLGKDIFEKRGTRVVVLRDEHEPLVVKLTADCLHVELDDIVYGLARLEGWRGIQFTRFYLVIRASRLLLRHFYTKIPFPTKTTVTKATVNKSKKKPF